MKNEKTIKHRPTKRQRADAIYDMIVRIDWPLLRDQKRLLLRISGNNDRIDADRAYGLLNLIDSLQDFAVNRLGIPEDQVFEKSNDPQIDYWVTASDMQKKARKLLADHGWSMLPGWSSYGEWSQPDELSTFTCRAVNAMPGSDGKTVEIKFEGHTSEEALEHLKSQLV